MKDGAAGPDAAGAVIAALRGARFFDGVPAAILASLAAEAERVDVAAGETLFRQGDASSELYVVRSGAISILRGRADGGVDRVADVFASAVALRDSELVRLSRGAIGALVERNPAVGLAIARVLAKRLAGAHDPRSRVARPRVFALLPHAELDPARAAAATAALLGELRRAGAVSCFDRGEAGRPRDWFREAEARSEYALFVGDPADPLWSAFCARQSDVTLLLADGDGAAAPCESWSAAIPPRDGEESRRELILIGDPAREPVGAGAWRAAAPHGFVHHVRTAADMARAARLILRRGVILVLSGGGARGFAHLGVVDALIEAGVAIDMFGGASMGAIIAAAYAGGWPKEMARERMRAAFVLGRPLSDPVFPVVALFRGRKVARLLEQAFGERAIEDLRHPFFCVSSCLTRAAPAVHRRGLLRRWLQASVAIPGVLPPVIEDGAMHVDGGIMDNLPIDAAVALERGPVIGVDVSGDEVFDRAAAPPPRPPLWQRWLGGRNAGDPGIMETLWRVGTVGSVSTSRRDGEAAALVIRPPVGTLGLLDWRSFDRAIDIGYAHTRALIAERPELFARLRRAP
jgi:NTE family protein